MGSRVVVHRDKIAEMFLPTGQIGRKAERAAGKVRDRAMENAPVRQGLLRMSITSELIEQGPTKIVWRIGTPLDYGLYQEVGTGPIHVRRAPLLVFKIGDRWVSTLSTRGVPAVRYLTHAIERVGIEDFL